jgi:NAD(P)-dependent dehydrogenase (short-subunit alcohol dehydrogenase family)
MDLTSPFAGKVALVTGAGHGIGRAEALELARRGAAVVVNDLDRGTPTAAEQVVAEIRAVGGEAVAAHGSVSRPAEAEAIVATAVDTFGRLDILVNNAGFGRVAPIWELADKDWEAVIAVNLTGTFLMARAAARVMRRQRSGVIINTASEAATGDTYFGAYMAAKAGVVGLTRGIARDLIRDNVRCNAICPRAFDTAQTNVAAWEKLQRFNARYGVAMCGPHPMGPIPGTAAEVAAIVAWLCTDDCADVTGRILIAGCGEVGLWAEPRPVSPLIDMAGWTLERLHAVRHHLTRDLANPFRDLPDEAWAEIDERYRDRIDNGATAAGGAKS